MLTSLLQNKMYWVKLKAIFFPLNPGLEYFISKFKTKREMPPFGELSYSLPPNHSVLARLVYFLPLLQAFLISLVQNLIHHPAQPRPRPPAGSTSQ